jgi:DNA polymerase-1
MFIETVAPQGAKIMLVGEAPGAEEDARGEPFVGYAGRTLNTLLGQAGIRRGECIITNVVRNRPKDNNIDLCFLNKKHTVPTPETEEHIILLKKEIETYSPNIVVTLGAIANWALTGNVGIKAYRGAVVESTLVPDQKVLPTYHPQAVNYTKNLFYVTVLDLRKAKRHSGFPEIPEDKRNLITNPTVGEWEDYCEQMVKEQQICALDIETPYRKSHISWLGLSHNANFAMSMNVLRGKYPRHPENDEIRIFKALGRVLQYCPLVYHNAVFDAAVLWKHHALPTRHIYMDTMIAAHTCWTELPKSLGFISSICLDVPAWKHTAQLDEGLYNAADAANTRALVPVLEKVITDFDVRKTYEAEMAQIEPVMMMNLNGIIFNTDKQQEILIECKDKMKEAEESLKHLVGKDVNYNSPKQVNELLYIQLDLPPQFKRRKSVKDARKLTSDKEALKKLSKSSSLNAVVPQLILEHRKYSKRKSSFVDCDVSPEGKVYTSYNITATDTGRWSSSKSIIDPFGPKNFQTIPEDLRILFEAPPGKVLVGADFVQAEAVIVAFESLDNRLMQLFRESFGMSPSQRKISNDVHRLTASILFQISYKDVTKEQRRIGKTLRHACNYDAGATVVANGVECSLKEGKQLKALYMARNLPLVLYQKRIQAELRKSKVLVTCLGRKRRFFSAWGDELFRSAYAYKPQSTIGDLLNGSLVEFYERYGDDYTIALQLHDAMYVYSDNNEEAIEDCVVKMRKCMVKPLTINRETVLVDVDFKVGENWLEMKTLDWAWKDDKPIKA